MHIIYLVLVFSSLSALQCYFSSDLDLISYGYLLYCWDDFFQYVFSSWTLEYIVAVGRFGVLCTTLYQLAVVAPVASHAILSPACPGCSILYSDQCIHGETSAAAVYLMVPTRLHAHCFFHCFPTERLDHAFPLRLIPPVSDSF